MSDVRVLGTGAVLQDGADVSEWVAGVPVPETHTDAGVPDSVPTVTPTEEHEVPHD